MQKNKLPLFVGMGVFIILVALVIWIVAKPKANNEKVEQVETPPTVQKVNEIPLAQRPFVNMLIRPAEGSCEGMDLVVSSLKNNETKFDYFVEYITKKGLIEVINGNRDLTVEKKHDPLLFGTCSSGACTCQKVVDGSLKLTLTGSQEYILKGDFTYQNVGDKEGILKSKDSRLTLDVNKILSTKTDVLISSSFGLPAELDSKVLLGPYNITAYNVDKLTKPIKASMQSKDAAMGKVQFWNGEEWKELESTVDGDTVSFELNSLGVVALTE